MNDRNHASRPAAANILIRPRFASYARALLAAASLLWVAVLAPGPAQAQTQTQTQTREKGVFIGGESRNLFEARGIPVDVTAATVTEARERALTQGRVEALRVMVEHLATPEEATKLPPLQANQIIDMVREFSLANERTSAVRYIAEMTVRFDPDAVRRLLRASKIPFTEFLSKPMVLLPLYIEGGKTQLWEESNPWREAWLRVKDRSALVPLVLASGDTDITVAQVVGKDRDALQDLANRYDAAGVIVARATANGDTLALVYSDLRGAAPPVDAAVGFAPQAGQSREDMMTGAATALARAVADAWKKNNRFDVSVTAQLTALAPIKDLKEWVRMRDRLKDVPAVQHIDVQAITRDRAQVTLRYAGDQARLESALAQQSLTLNQQGGVWILGTTGRKAEPTPPAAPPAVQ